MRGSLGFIVRAMGRHGGFSAGSNKTGSQPKPLDGARVDAPQDSASDWLSRVTCQERQDNESPRLNILCGRWNLLIEQGILQTSEGDSDLGQKRMVQNTQ